MPNFIAKRVRFRNGERHSVLSRPGGLPVHETTLYLAGFRTRGRAANTIHAVCTALAMLYRWLDTSQIELLPRLRRGQFLTMPELVRLAGTCQYRVADLSGEEVERANKVVDIKRIRLRRKVVERSSQAVDVATQASRLRYIADYLQYLSTYVGATLKPYMRDELERVTAHSLKAFLAHVPPVSKRTTLGARQGLSEEEQTQLVEVIRPDSQQNPWKRSFVRQRNWLIVVLLLATGMRSGELLGLQIDDLAKRLPKFRIIRRADSKKDPRPNQPNAKTNDREVEVRPAIMRAVLAYIRQRRGIEAARKFPQLIVADDGRPLSSKSIDKIFTQLRQKCPGLPVDLTSHVMRHTWNERFSEQAELLQLSDAVEEKARNEQQGWADNSKTAQTYTRRYATRKGREVSLKLQEKLDVPDQ
ncbi:tyrosine-type recombinase/integrase [Massilia sp. NEAU-DD11]|uniref:Tyrosine-type recombinase/integrase n=2 Tax=Massilia cellulosiltytica TaxID=2683234 RepID=A0A7X3K5T9_9BURK|nr:tyrosine-type recombinase/integrase [Telluria cellulosilytica]